LKVAEEAREAVMAHARPGIKGTYDLYDYFDEKREALEMWGARVSDVHLVGRIRMLRSGSGRGRKISLARPSNARAQQATTGLSLRY
jgi:hypothetical protein